MLVCALTIVMLTETQIKGSFPRLSFLTAFSPAGSERRGVAATQFLLIGLPFSDNFPQHSSRMGCGMVQGDTMKTRFLATLVFVIFIMMAPRLHAVRAKKSSSDYGFGGQYSSQVFGNPPIQYAHGAIATAGQTVEVCNDTDSQCADSHAFIYAFQLPDGDPGTITSITLTVDGQDGALFAQSPTWGVITCADPPGDGSPAPCSDPKALLTACAETTTVTEAGIGTSTYSQTWTFAGCPPFVAGQKLAIFLSLCTPWNTCADSQDNPSPVIDYQGGAGILVSVGVSRPAQFVAAPPCRLVDTRLIGGPIWGGTSRDFIVPDLGGCNVPPTATAYSLNVTAIPRGKGLGFLTVWPTGEGQPVTSTLNSQDGRGKANAAIVPAGDQDSISVYVSDTSDLVLDIDGYFEPPSDSTLAFYPLPPCRVADTRSNKYPKGLGPPTLGYQEKRELPILSSDCFAGIPNTAQAYSFNVTVVPPPGTKQPLGFLTVWPAGTDQPVVSTLNNPAATAVANAAIVGAGQNGDIDVYASDPTDLVIDIDGYFATPGQGGLSLYAVYPCRVLDTRGPGGNGPPFSGTLTVDVLGSPCAPSSQAQAYVFNATVVPKSSLSFLTLWPDGLSQPIVSTLNAFDGAVASNMAIVPAGNQGKIDAYATDLTQLILDISGYFAP